MGWPAAENFLALRVLWWWVWLVSWLGWQEVVVGVVLVVGVAVGGALG